MEYIGKQHNRGDMTDHQGENTYSVNGPRTTVYAHGKHCSSSLHITKKQILDGLVFLKILKNVLA